MFELLVNRIQSSPEGFSVPCHIDSVACICLVALWKHMLSGEGGLLNY